MRILFYAPNEFSLPRKLFAAIQEAGLSGVELEHLRHGAKLRQRLLKSGQEPSLIVLYPADRQELRKLVEMQDLFTDFRLILIAPDDTDETIALAHRLRPRFLCYIDDYADKVGEVAWNILRRNDIARFST